MLKSPNKGMADYDLALISKIKDIEACSEQLAKILLDNILFKIRRYMADLIITASRNARLSGYDEKIYETYKNLIEYYELSIKKYEECVRMLVNPKIKVIIDGIYSVLKSETRNKEETIIETGDNPILSEKKEIISQSLHFFAKAIENTADAYINERYTTVQHNFLMAALVQNDDSIMQISMKTVEDIKNECFSSFSKFFTDSLKYCVSNLNDLESRKTTNFYYELLEKETEILSSIVKIQVLAVDNEKNNSASEKMAINSILSYLLEAYQVLSKNMTEIKSCFNSTENSNHYDVRLVITPELMLGEEFEYEMLNIRKFSSNMTKIENNTSELKDILKYKLKVEIEEDLFRRHIRKKAYYYNLKIAQLIDMTDEMINSFKEITGHYDANAGSYAEGESLQIIKGICETVLIKIECLEENKAAFTHSAEHTLSGLKSCTADINPDEFSYEINKAISLIFETNVTKAYEDDKDEKKYIAAMKSILFEAAKEKVQKYRDEFTKKTAIYDEQLEKRDYKFKKDHLLYEVTTFEEILNYSVTRIAEDPDANVAAFVEAVYASVDTVDITLKKNGIFKIKPKPHELFNSKEHEVLMVEKNPDFNKGEVIKLLNSGYKQNDLVVIRANIIAAK